MRWWLALGLVGCAGGSEEEEFHPSLSFLSPAEGATVPAGELQVSIVVDDFELVPSTVAAAAPPVGGLPLWLLPSVALAHDEEGVPSGVCELRLDGAVVGTMDGTQLAITVAAGAHELEGELLYADGDALEEPVVASVSFTAE